MNTEDAIQSVERLNVAPDDIAVVRIAEHCPPGLQREIARQIADAMPDLQGRVVILPHGYEVATLQRDTHEALRAWQAAWGLQGEDRVHAMVNAARLTDEALEGIP